MKVNMKIITNLEKASWVASILAAAVGVVALFVTSGSQVTVNGSGNTTVQGNNNVVLAQPHLTTYIKEHAKQVPAHLPVLRDGHKVTYFQFEEDLPGLQMAKINALVKEKVSDIYRKNHFYSAVDISATPEFIDFGLMGVSVTISLREIDVDVLKKNGVPQNEALFLMYMASAHPLQTSTGFVIKVANAAPYEFKDLFRHDGLKGVSEVTQFVLKTQGKYFQCSQERARQSDFDFDAQVLAQYLGYRPENCFESLRPDAHFYLTPQAVVVRYSRYEIGPGMLGAPELALPYEGIKPFVNPNGPLAFLVGA